MDRARDLGELGADVVGLRLDLAAQRADRRAQFALLFVEQRDRRRRFGGLRAAAAPPPSTAGAIGALSTRFESQSGQTHEAAPRLALVSGAVGKPALERHGPRSQASANLIIAQPASSASSSPGAVEIVEIVAAADMRRRR